MAQKPEAKYKAKIHRKLPEYVYHQGMYTPFSAGTPDHWYSGVEADLWIEYKWQEQCPKLIHLCNPGVKYPMLTSKQQSWLKGRYNEGRNVAVVYATKEGSIIFEHGAWEYPMEKETFFHLSLDVEEVVNWIVRKVSIKKHVKNKKEVLPL